MAAGPVSPPAPQSSPAGSQPDDATAPVLWQYPALWWRLSYSGVAGAVLFACLSLTPSLLPRTWVFQGLVTGISAAIGYGLGALFGYTARRLIRWEPRAEVKRIAWRALVITGVVLPLAFLARSGVWQQRIHQAFGVHDPPSLSYLAASAVALPVFLGLVAAGRLLRRAERFVSRRLHRWIPPRVAGVIGAALVGVVAVGMLDGVVLQSMFAASDRVFATINTAGLEGARPPTSALRSGGPGSLVPWGTLGVRGQDFVSGGPSTAELKEFSGRAAVEPVRVYVGLDTAEDVRERAALAVKELERAGGFERAVLCVVSTTGTGRVDRASAAALEYLHNGDTALVAMQYSYLPSWLSFQVDQSRAAVAGQELFNQVYERWSDLPAGDRPLLFAFGVSLGSYASESAFSSLADVRNRVDGALWVGPPNFNPLWRRLVERRDAGSPERLPVHEGGETVRFASQPDDIWAQGGSWPRPRVLYLQHASDPVVWWSPRLILRRPDWLEEPRGPDVLPNVGWYPFVTFWQVSADLTHANHVPPGHGHLYGSLVADAWAAVAPAEGWTPGDTARLRALLEQVVASEPW